MKCLLNYQDIMQHAQCYNIRMERWLQQQWALSLSCLVTVLNNFTWYQMCKTPFLQHILFINIPSSDSLVPSSTAFPSQLAIHYIFDVNNKAVFKLILFIWKKFRATQCWLKCFKKSLIQISCSSSKCYQKSDKKSNKCNKEGIKRKKT